MFKETNISLENAWVLVKFYDRTWCFMTVVGHNFGLDKMADRVFR